MVSLVMMDFRSLRWREDFLNRCWRIIELFRDLLIFYWAYLPSNLIVTLDNVVRMIRILIVNWIYLGVLWNMLIKWGVYYRLNGLMMRFLNIHSFILNAINYFNPIQHYISLGIFRDILLLFQRYPCIIILLLSVLKMLILYGIWILSLCA